MTLNTKVFLLSPDDHHEVFHHCRELLNTPPEAPWTDEPDTYSGGGRWDLRNPGAIGLNAWLWTYYSPDGWLRPTDVHTEDCEPGCDGGWHDPPHWSIVTFDTAYGYRDSQGRGCGALHASIVARLGAWLDARGTRWSWQNEFTGEHHIGDRYERLMDLFGQGDDARAWFLGTVVPLIAGRSAPERKEQRP